MSDMETDQAIDNTLHSDTLDVVPTQRKTPFELRPLRAVTGLIEKKGNGSSAVFSHRIGEQWNVQESVSVDFIVDIEKRFSRKLKSFGFFEQVGNDIPTGIVSYCQTHPFSEDAPFETIANTIIERLAISATEKSARSEASGNVIIMHYLKGEHDIKGKLLVIHLDKKKMYDFYQDTLKPKTSEPIDTSSIKQAASINLDSMTDHFPNVPDEPYMRLIEGTSRSMFFKSALGCEECISKKDSAEIVTKALEDFMATKEIDISTRSKLRDGLKDLYKEHSKANSKPINLELVQKRLDKILPDNSPHTGLFIAFANDNDYEVNLWFTPSANDARKAGMLTIEDPNESFKISVSRNQIGTETSGKPVTITDDGNYIKFPISDGNKLEIENLLGNTEQD